MGCTIDGTWQQRRGYWSDYGSRSMDEYTLVAVERTTGTSITLLTGIPDAQVEEVENALAWGKEASGLLLTLLLSEPNED